LRLPYLIQQEAKL